MLVHTDWIKATGLDIFYRIHFIATEHKLEYIEVKHHRSSGTITFFPSLKIRDISTEQSTYINHETLNYYNDAAKEAKTKFEETFNA